MPAGLIVRNDANTYQITDSYYNLSLRQAGVYAFDDPGPFNGLCVYRTIDFNAVGFPIVAFRCDRPMSLQYLISTGPNTWRARFVGDATVGHGFSMYVFDRPTIPANGVGMAVWDAQGNPVYYSGDRHCKISDVVTGINFNNLRTHPTSVLPAIVPAAFPYQYNMMLIPDPGDGTHPWNGQGQTVLYSTQTNSISMHVGIMQMDSGNDLATNPPPPTLTPCDGSLLIIDAAGL